MVGAVGLVVLGLGDVLLVVRTVLRVGLGFTVVEGGFAVRDLAVSTDGRLVGVGALVVVVGALVLVGGAVGALVVVVDLVGGVVAAGRLVVVLGGFDGERVDEPCLGVEGLIVGAAVGIPSCK